MKKHDFCRASSLPDFECNNCGNPPEHPIHDTTHCTHCTFVIDCDHMHEHLKLCCDCFDLSWGMSLEAINKERAAKGLPLLTREWQS
jgi:hypothetical protein